LYLIFNSFAARYHLEIVNCSTSDLSILAYTINSHWAAVTSEKQQTKPAREYFVMIQIYKNTTIYVMAPASFSSGGPELLHQLCHKLVKLGYNAMIYYHPDAENPVHPNFVKYNCRYVTQLEDKQEHVLVMPETFFFMAGQFKNIRKCGWWLSVDNLFKTKEAPKHYRFIKKMGLPGLYKWAIMMGKIKGKFTYHVAQSVYAVDFVQKWGMEAGYLSDYLNDGFLQQSKQATATAKKAQVLYNPLKGLAFTQKIMAAVPEVKWIPIQHMTPAQVGELLNESMLYIDFGEHPGKDRFPREAAIYKCCVITGKKGSAAFQEDVPIPERYKIEDTEANLPEIAGLIRSCLSDYNEHIRQFDSYRDWIYGEEAGFEKDITTIFKMA